MERRVGWKVNENVERRFGWKKNKNVEGEGLDGRRVKTWREKGCMEGE